MNRVILMGRLTADPVIRTTPANKRVCSFTLAVDRRYAKEGQQRTDFINCVAWEKTGDFIATYFSKGAMLAVEGRLQIRSWDNPAGKKQYTTEVVADAAYFTGEKRERQSSGYPYEPQKFPDYGGKQESFDDSGFIDLSSSMDLGDASEDDLPF